MHYTALRNLLVNGQHIAAGSTFAADADTAAPLLAMRKIEVSLDAVKQPAEVIDLDEPAAGDAYDAPKAKRGKR